MTSSYISRSDIQAKVSAIKEAAREKVWEEYKFLAEEIFEEYLEPKLERLQVSFERFANQDIARLDTMITSLDFVIESLREPVHQEIGAVKDIVEDWQGTAADSFEENFLIPFPRINANHLEVAENLRRAVEASRDLVNKSRQSLLEIGDRAIDALHDLDTDDDGGWGIALAVVGAVAAVAATAITLPAGGVGGVLLGLSLVGGGAGIASASIGQTRVEGGSVEDILESLFAAISALRQSLYEEEGILADCLKADLAKIKESDVFLPQTSIATANYPRLSDFRLPPLIGEFVEKQPDQMITGQIGSAGLFTKLPQI